MTIEKITDKITLIHGDCMEYLRELRDRAFEIAVCDPPYGDGNFTQPPHHQAMSRDGGGGSAATNGQWSRFGQRFDRYKRAAKSHGAVCEIQTAAVTPPHTQCADSQDVKKGIWWDVAPSKEYFDELFRVSENQIIWGGNYFGLPPTRCFLIWRKLSISERFSMAMAEYAWTSFNANAKVFEHTPQGTKDDPRFHPTAKPIKLYEWQYLNYAKEGDRILDTHMGSGSSAIAAYNLGFEFVGIEIDGEYYEGAKSRLLRHIERQRYNPTIDFEY